MISISFAKLDLDHCFNPEGFSALDSYVTFVSKPDLVALL